MPRKSRCYMLPVHVARHVYYLHCVSKGVNFMIPPRKCETEPTELTFQFEWRDKTTIL